MNTKEKKVDIDRLPPHEADAEQAILACILLSPISCIVECVSKMKPGGKVFYDLKNRALYETMVDMWEGMDEIDIITLGSRLKNDGLLEKIGGLAHLSSLPECVPSAANLEYYIDIVLDKYVLRRALEVCQGAISRIYDYEGEVEELMGELEKKMLSISDDRNTSEIVPVKELVGNAITKIEEFHQRQGVITGISTGLIDLDKITTGLHPGEMFVIAARPGKGKTSLAMNIAEHVAIEQKLPVGVFSLEMMADALILRMICSRARIDIRHVTDGFLAERDFPKLTGAAGKIAASKMFIDDTSGLSILQLRAKARRMWQEHGIKLFVIDYMQLLNSTSRKADNRQQEIADISGGLKNMAKELGVPVIVLSQLNREVEKRGPDAKPRMSDLRECLSIDTTLIYTSDGAVKNSDDKMATYALEGGRFKVIESENIPKESAMVIRVVTKNGRFIDCTPNHRILTNDGWIAAGDLEAENLLATIGDPSTPILKLENAHIVWDGVKSIYPIGVKQVFDRQVPGAHNFIANGIVVHNSGSIEQDGDLIGLLYHEEPNEDDASDAPSSAVKSILHIAKQRNGPTGDVNLTFLKNYTRFESAAKIHESDVQQEFRQPHND